MLFIVQKAFDVHLRRMRGLVLTLSVVMALGASFLIPERAFARENEQNDAAICTDPKHRHFIIRSLTESWPIRKKEKARVRRVLM